MALRVIIAGSRNFEKYDMLVQVCSNILTLRGDIEVISGRARGADRLGEKFAKEWGASIRYFIPEWDKHGKKAGYLRNVEMAKNADMLIAFWDGKSRGTQHMINIAKAEDLEVYVKYY